MASHKGKPSGKFANKKSDIGRKGDLQRTGWPEDAPTQRVESGAGLQGAEDDLPTEGSGRNNPASP